MSILLASAGAAKADCLEKIGELRQQVDSQNQMRPTAQSRAAANELQKLERDELADEVDCYNTLAKGRNILAAPFPSPADDRYAKDHHGAAASQPVGSTGPNEASPP
jgi:hypothetical protein